MAIAIDTKNLRRLLKNFYTITGVRCGVYDLKQNEVLAYPKDGSEFCKTIKANPEGASRCKSCDCYAQELIRKGKLDSYVYTCHAGLLDASAPIIDADKIVGYMMIGQCISKDMDISSAWEDTLRKCQSYIDLTGAEREFHVLPQLSSEQVEACVHILTACTNYVILKDYVRTRPTSTFADIDAYIMNHLCGDLSVEMLCTVLLIPRNKLFRIVKDETGMTLHRYILIKRLHKAKILLRRSNKPIAEVAEKCGIKDYNYFSRVFKNRFGITPSGYRASMEAVPVATQANIE